MLMNTNAAVILALWRVHNMLAGSMRPVRYTLSVGHQVARGIGVKTRWLGKGIHISEKAN